MLILLADGMFADTYTVTNPADGGAGSLRQAILDANNHPNSGGPDQIHFAIPGSGVHTIAPLSALPAFTEPTVIDGLTQPGASGASWPPTLTIVLNGASAGATADGLTFNANADNSVVRGLVINQFRNGIYFNGLEGGAIHCNFVGTDVTGTIALGNRMTGISIEGSANGGNQVGGGTPETRNLISGNGTGIGWNQGINSGTDRAQGNFIGTDVTGTLDLGNTLYGIGQSAGAKPLGKVVIGGPTAGARNIISGNDGDGLAIGEAEIQGNYIGTDVTGTAPLGNGGNGISNLGVGCTIRENVISANGQSGVLFHLFSTGGGLIQGNQIGTDVSGTANMGNGRDGVTLTGSIIFCSIGKSFETPGPILPNVIAFNQRDGVRIDGTSARNVINYNSIFGNGGLGINLNGDGVSPNDSDDSDSGPNGLQNFPVLTSAVNNGATTRIQGTLKSKPNFKHTIQFFSNTAADPSTYGEGQVWLGDHEVTTDGSGNATIDGNVPSSVVAGTLITATATLTDPAASAGDQYNSTSEFSQAIRITGTAGRLLNIATRLRVQNGENVLIGGFIITGSDPKKVIIRAIGPSLAQFFSGALANPTLDLFEGSTVLQSNNDWKESQQAEIEATGVQPTNDLESAIVRTLAPGSYTAVVKGAGGNTGIGLVEAYDLDQVASSQLANIATRGLVESGNDVMIGGFIAGGGGGGAVKVVVRAIGPTLSSFGIMGALQDPTLELRDSNGALIAGNDNWRQTQQAELQQTGLAPSDDRESAILAILNGAGYTAIVRGSGNTTGVAIVEVYNLP